MIIFCLYIQNYTNNFLLKNKNLREYTLFFLNALLSLTKGNQFLKLHPQILIE